MYQLPHIDPKKLEEKVSLILGIVFFVAVAIWAGVYSGFIPQDYFARSLDFVFDKKTENAPVFNESQDAGGQYVSHISYEQAIIAAVKEASPSVVSIIISKNVPVYEQQLINPFGDFPGINIQIPQNVQKGTELKQVGAGSGFIVSEDGLVLTNKHVLLEEKAEYIVIANDGKKYQARVLALDPVQDLGILKIELPVAVSGEAIKFKAIKLGNSDGIQIGQGAIAIGNALGKFTNTVSVGIVSGLERTIDASNQTGSFSERLEGIIQTDAAINQGNSGGPLIHLRVEGIGGNVATAQGAQTIGFAIPINIAKRDINQVIKTNKISYPFLGVRYILVDEANKKKHGLSVDYGAYILKGENGEVAITAGSGAEKAGLKERDIILEIGGEKITLDNSLSLVIAKHNPGDTVKMKILRDESEMDVEVVLGERS